MDILDSGRRGALCEHYLWWGGPLRCEHRCTGKVLCVNIIVAASRRIRIPDRQRRIEIMQEALQPRCPGIGLRPACRLHRPRASPHVRGRLAFGQNRMNVGRASGKDNALKRARQGREPMIEDAGLTDFIDDIRSTAASHPIASALPPHAPSSAHRTWHRTWSGHPYRAVGGACRHPDRRRHHRITTHCSRFPHAQGFVSSWPKPFSVSPIICSPG